VRSIHGKIFLWIGKGANLNEKKEATARAVQYLAEHGLPANTPIERVSQGTESASFKSEFHVWDAPISFHMNAKVRYGPLPTFVCFAVSLYPPGFVLTPVLCTPA
jgi:hypothetical protein